jgi:hypothetical protein
VRGILELRPLSRTNRMVGSPLATRAPFWYASIWNNVAQARLIVTVWLRLDLSRPNISWSRCVASNVWALAQRMASRG